MANSPAHAASSIGGSAPVTGRHSVIDSPESVSRVAPPTPIIATTSANRTISQIRIACRAPLGRASIRFPFGVARAAGALLPTSSKMLRFGLMKVSVLCAGE